MATNEVFRDADHLSLPVPAGKKSGDPVRVGGLNGVCETDRSTTAAPAGGNPDGFLIDQTPAHGRVAIRSPLLDFTITLTDAAG